MREIEIEIELYEESPTQDQEENKWSGSEIFVFMLVLTVWTLPLVVVGFVFYIPLVLPGLFIQGLGVLPLAMIIGQHNGDPWLKEKRSVRL